MGRKSRVRSVIKKRGTSQNHFDSASKCQVYQKNSVRKKGKEKKKRKRRKKCLIVQEVHHGKKKKKKTHLGGLFQVGARKKRKRKEKSKKKKDKSTLNSIITNQLASENPHNVHCAILIIRREREKKGEKKIKRKT